MKGLQFGLGFTRRQKFLKKWFQETGYLLGATPASCYYDFKNNRYQEGGAEIAMPLSVTRTSVKYVYNSSGLLVSVPSNTLALDYNPATLAARGALVEGQSANKYLFSEQLDNAAWGKYQSSVVANSILAPDGNMTGDTLLDTAVADQHSVAQTLGGIVSGYYGVMSAYLKAGTSPWARLFFQQGANSVNCWFNLATGNRGTLTGGSGTLTNTSAGMQNIGGGWYRCWLKALVSSASNIYSASFVQTADNQYHYTGNGSNSVHMWGHQFEQGAGIERMSSYIPTAGSIITRQSDVVTRSLGPWFNPLEGTLFTEFELDYIPAGSFPRVMHINDGTDSNYITNFVRDTGLYNASIASASAVQMDIVGTAYTPGDVGKMLTAYKLNDSQFVHKGGVLPADTACLVPSGLNAIRFGDRPDGVRTLNGWIGKGAIFPIRGLQADMQAMAT